MKQHKEQGFEELRKRIEAASPYGRAEPKPRKWMAVSEMGKLLGLKKTDRYWLIHKNYFRTENVMGILRVDIASFEKWYANQVKYRKVTGEEPGLELKESSLSPGDIAELLGVTTDTAYSIIRKNKLETVIVDYWKRVPKEVFWDWYYSQSRYRTKEDRERDAAVEAETLTMPEILFEEAFYAKKNLDPKIHETANGKMLQVPEGVDAEVLAKVLGNPELTALLTSLARTLEKA